MLKEKIGSQDENKSEMKIRLVLEYSPLKVSCATKIWNVSERGLLIKGKAWSRRGKVRGKNSKEVKDESKNEIKTQDVHYEYW